MKTKNKQKNPHTVEWRQSKYIGICGFGMRDYRQKSSGPSYFVIFLLVFVALVIFYGFISIFQKPCDCSKAVAEALEKDGVQESGYEEELNLKREDIKELQSTVNLLQEKLERERWKVKKLKRKVRTKKEQQASKHEIKLSEHANEIVDDETSVFDVSWNGDNWKDDVYIQTMGEQENRWPFQYFEDDYGHLLPIVSVSGFFRTAQEKDLFYEYLRHGVKMIGITAYKTFPRKINHVSEDQFHLSDDFEYTRQIQHWFSCFKNNTISRYGFTDAHNLIDMSESDFYDVEDVSDETNEKVYDFVYVCLKDPGDPPCDPTGWNAINRNFKLAQQAFPMMFHEMNLTGLIIGRTECGLEQLYGKNVEVVEWLNWNELQAKMRKTRFLFLPNILDASPRVISECLIKGVPVVMNKNILCGTKYVNEKTGVLFSDVSDLKQSIELLQKRLRDGVIDTKSYWAENFSMDKSGKRLRDHLYSWFPEIMKNTHYAKFANWSGRMWLKQQKLEKEAKEKENPRSIWTKNKA